MNSEGNQVLVAVLLIFCLHDSLLLNNFITRVDCPV